MSTYRIEDENGGRQSLIGIVVNARAGSSVGGTKPEKWW